MYVEAGSLESLRGACPVLSLGVLPSLGRGDPICSFWWQGFLVRGLCCSFPSSLYSFWPPRCSWGWKGVRGNVDDLLNDCGSVLRQVTLYFRVWAHSGTQVIPGCSLVLGPHYKQSELSIESFFCDFLSEYKYNVYHRQFGNYREVQRREQTPHVLLASHDNHR